MHHAPRATRQLRFDATEWETPTIAQIAVYYSALRNMRKVRKTMCVGEGVTILLLSFLGFKIPRQQSPPTYKLCPAVFTLAAQHAPRLIN